MYFIFISFSPICGVSIAFHVQILCLAPCLDQDVFNVSKIYLLPIHCTVRMKRKTWTGCCYSDQYYHQDTTQGTVNDFSCRTIRYVLLSSVTSFWLCSNIKMWSVHLFCSRQTQTAEMRQFQSAIKIEFSSLIEKRPKNRNTQVCTGVWNNSHFQWK